MRLQQRIVELIFQNSWRGGCCLFSVQILLLLSIRSLKSVERWRICLQFSFAIENIVQIRFSSLLMQRQSLVQPRRHAERRRTNLFPRPGPWWGELSPSRQDCKWSLLQKARKCENKHVSRAIRGAWECGCVDSREGGPRRDCTCTYSVYTACSPAGLQRMRSTLLHDQLTIHSYKTFN